MVGCLQKNSILSEKNFMMKTTITLLLILITSFKLFSQENAGNYIELLNGEIVNLDGQAIDDRFFFTNKLKAKGAKYATGEVKGYQNDGIYYKQHNNKFHRRYQHGKVNFYYSTETTTRTSMGAGGTMETRNKTKLERFIQKGEKGKMVRYSVNSLRTMIKDNKAAVKQLKKFDRTNKIGGVIIWPASVVLLVGAYFLVDNVYLQEKEDRNPTLATVGGVTAAVGLGAYGYGFYKKIMAVKELNKVFEIYNNQ
jgi:hypothetical protein